MNPIDQLTWAVLLGRWVDFARGAVALPDEGESGRVKASVADAIMLQAVWFALGQVDELPGDQRALGLDRAAVLIEKHETALRDRWRDEPLPAAMEELLAEAREAFRQAEETCAARRGGDEPTAAGDIMGP